MICERRLKDCRKTSYFLQFARNNTSQGGEDGIFEEIFNLIGVSSSPFCVDIGAWVSVVYSSLKFLID
jgi:hypothetical protein